ncbi:hypothetical protein GCM10023080_090730 [Streptomyces pseudoechinosporeus]
MITRPMAAPAQSRSADRVVPWRTRSGPVPTAAEYSPVMAEVEVGMTRRQVKRLLGRPTETINERQYAASFSGDVIDLTGRGRSRSEAWMYVGVPQVGQVTLIYFERRRVAKVQTRPDPASPSQPPVENGD